ncbi:MAG: hypothetical protein HYT80_11140 [Euryarchaeota archaeon]|nr:hypothetical protein [Euryarchaeota archaeon]
MRRFVLALCTSLLVATVSGCLATERDADAAAPTAPVPSFGGEANPVRLPKPDFDFTKAIQFTHTSQLGHGDLTAHKGEHGLKLVGYNPLTRPAAGEGPAEQGASFIAIDTWQNYVCVAQFNGLGGAIIVDIKDPAKPVVVSSVPSGMSNSDCQFTDDGKYLLVAAYSGTHQGVPGAPPPVGDLSAQGVLVYDVADKAKPKFLYHDAQGAGANGYHNVFTAQIGPTHYVFQTYTGNILALEPTKLRMVGKVERADHDIWVGKHPVTGGWIMITGHGRGAGIYDVDDPAKPVLLDHWESHDEQTGWHRQWPLAQTVGGRAIMVVAGEYDRGWHTVLDFTDPNDIQELGKWDIPGRPQTGSSTFSPHEFETFDGYVATGNYHGGVWLFDVGSLERAKDPVTIGFYEPHENPYTSGGSWNKPAGNQPNTWGAYFDDRGYIVVADSFSGLYVLSFGATKGA